ncbi:small subunit of phenylpropionate dioxygenase [Fusarium beomiforme]|uniref:Small subunit of phenylpropionate dioxygenase n=1 Tax=Fusarium beomiforme TaxID=44412 RepID=A0A9P5ANZ6_9HYPO|nr:small subunit of phenylpropionate dioxygenase [Fusarium beomiforme]
MAQATSDHELIRNCIARYCIGIDLRDWNTFSNAFLDNVKTWVGNLQTQHALTTQLIELTGDKTAQVTTYGKAIHFGVGKDEGKCVTAWGIYQDKLVKGIFNGQEDWRIAERKVTNQAPFSGDLSLIQI